MPHSRTRMRNDCNRHRQIRRTALERPPSPTVLPVQQRIGFSRPHLRHASLQRSYLQTTYPFHMPIATTPILRSKSHNCSQPAGRDLNPINSSTASPSLPIQSQNPPSQSPFQERAQTWRKRTLVN